MYTHLQWCSSEEETVWGGVVLVEHLGELAMVVLHSMTLINDNVLPANLHPNTVTSQLRF